MDCCIGIKFDNFVLLAADQNAGRSIVRMKTDLDKMVKLSGSMVMVTCGEQGDVSSFSEFVKENCALQHLNNGYETNCEAIAHFTRHQLATSLRKAPYNVNCLLGGYDQKTKSTRLYFLDYLASLMPVPFASHGYGSYFTLSVLDRQYRPDMTPEEGYELLRMCIQEIKQRLIVNLDRYKVRTIDANGVRELEDIRV